MEIATFYDTKYFSIIEQEGQADERFKLTYYNYSTALNDGDPISEFESAFENDEDLLIVKANNHSKIAWFATEQS
jgi:hypothetical protein